MVAVGIYVACFLLAFYALSGCAWHKLVKNQSQGLILLTLSACALAYLAGQFIIGITLYRGVF